MSTSRCLYCVRRQPRPILNQLELSQLQLLHCHPCSQLTSTVPTANRRHMHPYAVQAIHHGHWTKANHYHHKQVNSKLRDA